MRILATLALLLVALFTVPTAKAQVQHVGAMANFQFEDKNSGNGTIAGGEIQSVQHFGKFVLKNNVQLTRDLKSYLNRYGTALRYHPRGRYYFPLGNDAIFLGGGANLSKVSYPDIPTAKDGYKKWAFAPVASAGFLIGDPGLWEAVIAYEFQPRAKLHSSPYTGGANNLDGWSTQHTIGTETAWGIKKTKWLVLANGSFGTGTYERNPGFYGPSYAGIKYHFNYFELSIGVGRKY